jgi:hypothetical protein
MNMETMEFLTAMQAEMKEEMLARMEAKVKAIQRDPE